MLAHTSAIPRNEGRFIRFPGCTRGIISSDAAAIAIQYPFFNVPASFARPPAMSILCNFPVVYYFIDKQPAPVKQTACLIWTFWPVIFPEAENIFRFPPPELPSCL